MTIHNLPLFNIILPLICLTGLFSVPTAAETTFRFCYEDRELAPYFFGTGNQVPAERPGITIEIMQKIDQELPDIHIEFVRRPWKRCLYSLERGSIEGVVGSYKPDRMKIGKYPVTNDQIDTARAFDRSAYCLFKNSGSEIQWDGQKFTGTQEHAIGVPLGYSITSLLNKHRIKIKTVESNQKAFSLLALNRLDGVATLCGPGKRLISSDKAKFSHVQIPPPLRQSNGYLIFSHQFYNSHTTKAETIWNKLVEVRQHWFDQLFETYRLSMSEAGNN